MSLSAFNSGKSATNETRRALNPPRALLLGYASLILVGSLLLSLPVSHAPGRKVGFVDAFFTATSATAVTGLVVVDTGEAFSLFGQIVILALIQIGGVGLMVSTTLFYVFLRRRVGIRQRRLVEMDLNQPSMHGVVRLSLQVLALTAVIEAVGSAVLYLVFQRELPAGQALFYAVFHAISAFCNAGFSLLETSLERYVGDPVVNLTIAGLIIVGGLGFSVLTDLLRHRRWSRLSFHSQVVLSMSAVLTFFGFFSVLLLEGANPDTLGALPPAQRVMAAFFQSVTTRTAGFNTVPIASMRTSTLFVLLALMFIGASPGSTGGGIKTTTVVTFAAILRSAILRKRYVELGRFRIHRTSIDGAFVVTLGAVMWTWAATLVLLISEEADVLQTLFEVVSAIGTVGLSLGLTDTLSAFGKFVLALTMFLGRVGPFAVALSLSPKEPRGLVRRPEKRLMVG